MNPVHTDPAPPHGAGARETTLRDITAALRRGRWTVLAVTAAVVAAVGLLTILLQPVYESEALLRIRTESPESGMLAQLGPLAALGLPGLGDEELDTEMGVLRSRRIAAAVVDSLDLHLRLLEPDTAVRAVLRVVRAGPDAVPGVYTFSRTENGTYRLKVFRNKVPLRVPPVVRAGEVVQVGRMALAVAPAPGLAAPDEIRLRVRSFERVVEKARERLKIDRQTLGSRLVEVAFRDSDPRTAAAVVNGAVATYAVYKERVDRSESLGTIEVLRDQVALYERSLRTAEDRLRTYQEQQRIIAPVEQATQEVRRLAAIQAQRDAVQVERESLATLLAQVGRRASRGGESPYRQLATFPSFIANQGVQDVLATLTTLENERSRLLVLRTEDNLEVRQLERRIRELEEQLYRLGTGYLQSLDNQITAASGALDRSARTLEAMPEREVEYARLARERELNGEVYLLLQKRLKEAEVSEAVEPEPVRVVDYGLVPEEPVFPRPAINLAVALVLGLMLGMAAVIGREVVSTRVRSRTDAEEAAAGVPVLAVLPANAAQRAGRGNGARPALLPRWKAHRRNGTAPGVLVARDDPWSAGAEAYRALLPGLLPPPGESGRVIVVASPETAAASGTVAANLALVLAQEGARTLLLDAYLRNGEMHALFGARSAPGLGDVLAGSAALQGALQTVDADSGLQMLAAGASPRNPGPVHEPLQRLLQTLRTEYHAVVVGAPPLSASADAARLAAGADRTLLVAQSGVTERETLSGAVARLQQAGARIAGIVLSAHPVNPARPARQLGG